MYKRQSQLNTNVSNLPIHQMHASFVYDTDNIREAVGICDYVFVVRPHPQLQPAVLRRPRLGNAGSGRHRHGWPQHGHRELLPLPAYPREHGPCTGAEPDRSSPYHIQIFYAQQQLYPDEAHPYGFPQNDYRR